MIDVELELRRLSNTLIYKGLSYGEMIDTIEKVRSDIERVIRDKSENALQAAKDKIALMGTRVNDLTVKKENGRVFIDTVSGKTKIDTPSRPMLGALLKNAKIAKDGSLYKRIPIGKTDMFEDQANALAAQKEKKIRTASSKQSPTSSWVYPARSVDIQSVLMEVNSALDNELYDAIQDIVRSYEF
jgi:hypothetical protein